MLSAQVQPHGGTEEDDLTMISVIHFKKLLIRANLDPNTPLNAGSFQGELLVQVEWTNA